MGPVSHSFTPTPFLSPTHSIHPSTTHSLTPTPTILTHKFTKARKFTHALPSISKHVSPHTPSPSLSTPLTHTHKHSPLTLTHTPTTHTHTPPSLSLSLLPAFDNLTEITLNPLALQNLFSHKVASSLPVPRRPSNTKN